MFPLFNQSDVNLQFSLILWLQIPLKNSLQKFPSPYNLLHTLYMESLSMPNKKVEKPTIFIYRWFFDRKKVI